MTATVLPLPGVVEAVSDKDLLAELARRVGKHNGITDDEVFKAIGYDADEIKLREATTQQIRQELETRREEEILIDTEELIAGLTRIRSHVLRGDREQTFDAARQLYLDALPVAI